LAGSPKWAAWLETAGFVHEGEVPDDEVAKARRYRLGRTRSARTG
jgi:hypothetical protein